MNVNQYFDVAIFGRRFLISPSSFTDEQMLSLETIKTEFNTYVENYRIIGGFIDSKQKDESDLLREFVNCLSQNLVYYLL